MRNLKFIIAFGTVSVQRSLKKIANKKGLIILLGWLATAGLIVLAGQNFGFFKPVVTQGVVGTFREEDLPVIVNQLLSDSLVDDSNSSSPSANLVENWQVGSDATVFTFKLKSDLYWLDGSKMRASEIDLPVAGADIKIIDDQTFQFKLADSFSPFPSLLNKPVFKKNSQRRAGSDSSHVGTGPYYVDQVVKDQIFVRKIFLKTQQKDLPNVTIKFYPNERIAKQALKLGEIQALLGVADLSGLEGQRNLVTLTQTNYQQLVAIFYNTKDKILADANLRRALSFAAPQIKEETKAITSIPSTSWAFNADVRTYLDNAEQASLALKKVGNWEELKKDQQPIVTLTATPFLKETGERVVEAWNKLGMKAVLRVESGLPQNFQALLIAQNIPADPDQYALWHSTQTKTNLTKLSSPRIDKDLEDGRKATSYETRKVKYADFQKELLEEAPATFLYFPKYNVVYMKKIEKDLQKVFKLQLPNL